MTGILQRLVCVATNFGLGQWGDEIFLVIARGVVERAGQVTAAPAQDSVLLLKERISAAGPVHVLGELPGGVAEARYGASSERDLRPWLWPCYRC